MEVVCGVIIQKGRFLLGKRPAHKKQGGLWEFPGGKVQPNESLKNALVRELREELHIKISTKDLAPLGLQSTQSLNLHFFFHQLTNPLSPQEHQALGWFRLDDVIKLPLCDLDRLACQQWSSEINKALKNSLT